MEALHPLKAPLACPVNRVAAVHLCNFQNLFFNSYSQFVVCDSRIALNFRQF